MSVVTVALRRGFIAFGANSNVTSEDYIIHFEASTLEGLRQSTNRFVPEHSCYYWYYFSTYLNCPKDVNIDIVNGHHRHRMYSGSLLGNIFAVSNIINTTQSVPLYVELNSSACSAIVDQTSFLGFQVNKYTMKSVVAMRRQYKRSGKPDKLKEFGDSVTINWPGFITDMNFKSPQDGIYLVHFSGEILCSLQNYKSKEGLAVLDIFVSGILRKPALICACQMNMNITRLVTTVLLLKLNRDTSVSFVDKYGTYQRLTYSAILYEPIHLHNTAWSVGINRALSKNELLCMQTLYFNINQAWNGKKMKAYATIGGIYFVGLTTIFQEGESAIFKVIRNNNQTVLAISTKGMYLQTANFTTTVSKATLVHLNISDELRVNPCSSIEHMVFFGFLLYIN